MRMNCIAKAGILLLIALFSCTAVNAATYDFGGITGNGEYRGTLAVDNNGNVAIALAAATGELLIIEQDSGDSGGAFATQSVIATGDSAFIGTGAANANGDTASSGALASGNAEIETIQGAIVSGAGVAAGQETYMEGQTAVAGSLGMSADGYLASTDTHLSDGGSIGTIQGAAAGRILFLGINAGGAIAGQISEIFAGNGAWASSTASGSGNTATTEASVSGEGIVNTTQVAGAGQVGYTGFPADISADGAFAGQYSTIESNGGGFTRSSATDDAGNTADTSAEYSRNGYIDTIQGAAAGGIGLAGLVDASVDGAIAGQYTFIESDNGGFVRSSATGINGCNADTSAEFAGNGYIDTIQGALAGETGIPGMASVSGVAAGQSSGITSDSGGTAFSSASIINVGLANTSVEFAGNGYIDTIQGAAAGEIAATGIAEGSVAGAVAGQSSSLVSDTSGNACTAAIYNNGYDRVHVGTFFNGNGSIDDIVQGAVAGRASIIDPVDIGVEGTAAFQETSLPAGNIMESFAAHDTDLLLLGSNSPALHWVVAGMLTDDSTTIEGVDGEIIL